MSSFISAGRCSPRSDDDPVERAPQAQAVSRGSVRAADRATLPRGALPPGMTVVDDVQKSLVAGPDRRRGGDLEHHPVERPLEIQTDLGRRRAQTQTDVVERSG